jgi:hypothetical protein
MDIVMLKSVFRKIWNPKTIAEFCRKYNIPDSTMCQWLRFKRRRSPYIETCVRDEIEIWVEEKFEKSFDFFDPPVSREENNQNNDPNKQTMTSAQKIYNYFMNIIKGSAEQETKMKTLGVEFENPSDITKMKISTRKEKIKIAVFLEFTEVFEDVIDKIECMISAFLFFEIHVFLFLPHRSRIRPEYLNKFWLDVLKEVRFRRNPSLFVMLAHISNLSLLLDPEISFFVFSRKQTVFEDLKIWLDFYSIRKRDFFVFPDPVETIKAIREKMLSLSGFIFPNNNNIK